MPRLPYTNFHDLNLNWFLKEFKKIIASVAGKQDAPAQPGTAGQVLGLNDNLQPIWTDPDTGTVDYTELENKPQINGVELSGNKTGSQLGVIDTPATPGTAGQVLGLDESLTPKWIDQEGGSIDLDITGTASGAIASFDDGADNEPLQDLLIAIEPVQAGSGDPSPSNIRPISGWTAVNVNRISYNIWDEQWEIGSLSNQGLPISGNSDTIRSKNFIPCKPNTIYYINKYSNVSGPWVFAIYQYDNNKNYVGTAVIYRSTNTFTTSLNAYYLKFRTYVAYGTTYNNDICINYPASYTDYTPYIGQTYAITLPTEAGTVYEGTFNQITGELVVTYGLLTSYNGETLPGKWLSDRDVYVAGTTPTIGAQVIYELANPIIYTLSSSELIRTLLGVNNIFADTGDILQCVYKADPNIYLQNVAKVKIFTPEENSLVLKPFPTTYNFGERTTLTLTATDDTYYKFMFKCPANSTTNITIIGVTDLAGDVILTAGKTYIVEIWAGIANYTELALVGG